MVSKGQIVGIDRNRIARLHSHVLAHPTRSRRVVGSNPIWGYHQLSCSLNMFKFDMIVHSFFFPFDRADERFRQTIMNYHGPFDRKHDSQ